MKGDHYRFLSANDVWAMNDAILRAEGDSSHVLSSSGLEGGVMRPAQAARYQPESDLATLTALLVAGVALAHAFLDGNKRTAAMAGMTFLRLNGYRIILLDETLGRQVEALVLATGAREEATAAFADWLRAVMVPGEED